jgi:two-component system cell cycle sensor histidine kinase/response regulator CckA
LAGSNDELNRLRERIAELERQLSDAPPGTGLAEREALMTEAERIVQVGSWVWDASTNRVAWSDELFRILGYDPATDQPSPDLFFARIHPEDRANVIAGGEKVASGAGRKSAAPDRARVLLPDGTIRHIEVDGRAVLGAQGPSRIVGTIRDITQSVNTAEELGSARSILEVLGEMEGLGTYTWDTESGVVHWSLGLRSLLGVGPDMAASVEKFMEYVHPEDVSELTKTMEDSATDGEASSPATFRIVQAGGAIRHIYAHSYAGAKPDGTLPTHFAGILLDVTHQHELEEKLRQAQKMEAVGMLAGGVAHDFNNYLMVALGNTELLGLDMAPNDPNMALVQEITAASQRSRLLVQRLLAFSRRQFVSTKVFAVNKLIDDLTVLVDRLVGDHIQVVVELGPDVGSMRADPTQVEQVLMNLLLNARDAMPTGGRVTVSSHLFVADEALCQRNPQFKPGRYARIHVADSGPGIPDQIRARIFEPFFTTKARGEGSGLGLSTAYGIVKQANGVLELEPDDGTGASFQIYLPSSDEQTDQPRESDNEQPRAGKGTILLVDDEEQVLRITTAQLERGGYTVLPVSTGREALVRARAHAGTIEMLLTDMRMPLMSGPQVARGIWEVQPGAAVGFMSGYAAEHFADEPEVNADVLLHKPFTLAEILAFVGRLMDRR